MGGKASRDKGARGERNLALYLRGLGYDARRVIRTRAVSGYASDVVPDIEVIKDGQVLYTFESKFSKDKYKGVYELFYSCRTGKEGVYRFSLPGGPCIAIGTDFEEVRKAAGEHFPTIPLDGSPSTLAHMRVTCLEKLLKGAQFLAVRNNNRPFIFIRFWS